MAEPRYQRQAAPSCDKASLSALSLVGQSAQSDQPFGHLLEPVLRQACGGRLSQVNWFRTDHQRGGALTGQALFTDDTGQTHSVVAKLPVSPRERQWLLRLQTPGSAKGNPDEECLAPRLLAHGETLGDYDMAWVVMENLPHGPLGSAWGGQEFDLLLQAVARFHSLSAALPVTTTPASRDWPRILETTRQSLARHDLAHEQRWKNVLKKVHHKLKDWVAIWNDRSCNQWCHGDVHLANGLSRHPPPQGPAVLIDFADVHPGHWIEDAINLEHQFWARRQKLQGRKLCSQLAHERKRLGLHNDMDWPRLASVRRALLAMSTPSLLQFDGDRHHVQAALEVLEVEAG